MQKAYSPIRIKNPNQKHSLVKLLAGQKLNVIFDKAEFQEYKLDVVGQYLSVSDIAQIENGWMATIVQDSDKIDFDDNTLFLGAVNLFDSADLHSASLCVVSNSKNDDVVRVVNPLQTCCNLDPSQVMDVVFYTNDANLRWSCYPGGLSLCAEQLQYVVRQPKVFTGFMYEHFFRFRYNSHSIKYVSEQPYGKYDGGQILFVSNKNDRSILNLTCSWRGRGSVYKALLMPKIPVSCAANPFRRYKKQALKSRVDISLMDGDSLETGCNVLISRI